MLNYNAFSSRYLKSLYKSFFVAYYFVFQLNHLHSHYNISVQLELIFQFTPFPNSFSNRKPANYIAMASKPDPDQFTTPFLLTKTGHRDPYPAISPEKPENSQKGKIIIITGGGAGIGAAAAKVWARAGASGIVIAARRLETLEEVAKDIKASNPASQVLPVKADISLEEDVKNLFASVQKIFGRPADVLLNNAGYLADDQLVGETPVADWWKTFVSILRFQGHWI